MKMDIMKTYKIKIGNKWISKDNLLMLTDNEENAAHLNADQTIHLQEMLSYAYENDFEIIKDGE